MSVRLQSVPPETREIYGEDYFLDFVNSVSDRSNSQAASKSRSNSIKNEEAGTSSGKTSGYSSASSSLKTKITPEEKQKLIKDTLEKAKYTTEKENRATPNLSNTNRVLHALVDACTSGSPKVRYFVGTFSDRLVKTMSNVVPTVIMDAYLTSGQMSKVIPQLLKEKME